MIDPIYIESAKSIRKESLELYGKLGNLVSEGKKLHSFLEEKRMELSKYADGAIPKIKTKTDIGEVVKKILAELESIDAEEKKLLSRYTEVNERLEFLKKQEVSLWDSLVAAYPNIGEKELAAAVTSRLDI